MEDWTTKTVVLHWAQGPDTIIRYILEYKRLNDVNPVVKVLPVDAAAPHPTEWIVEGLTPDTSYQFHLIAVNRNGRSTPSQWVSAKTIPLDPCNPNPCANNGTCKKQGKYKRVSVIVAGGFQFSIRSARAHFGRVIANVI